MKFLLLAASVLLICVTAIPAFTQGTPVSSIDIVKGKQVYEKEVMYFYEQNWKPFREEALKMKHISGFKMIKTKPDSTGYFTLVLLTQYPDSLHFQKAEENFRPIMKKLSPNGPKMLNEVKRKDFIQFVSSQTGEVLYQQDSHP